MTHCPHCGEALYAERIPTKPNKNRTCNCRTCNLCKNRERNKLRYQINRIHILDKKHEKLAGKDLDLEKLNIYWEKVRTK
jgi:hypothetical protein